jgi:dTDP-4-amino-4,6-dideoxygalactose transaminase
VIFDSEETTLRIKAALERNNIYPRRYFYPSLDTLEYVEIQDTTVSKDISKRILCMPLYHNLKINEQKGIRNIILKEYNYHPELVNNYSIQLNE